MANYLGNLIYVYKYSAKLAIWLPLTGLAEKCLATLYSQTILGVYKANLFVRFLNKRVSSLRKRT
jgi:hypothetical protein